MGNHQMQRPEQTAGAQAWSDRVEEEQLGHPFTSPEQGWSDVVEEEHLDTDPERHGWSDGVEQEHLAHPAPQDTAELARQRAADAAARAGDADRDILN